MGRPNEHEIGFEAESNDSSRDRQSHIKSRARFDLPTCVSNVGRATVRRDAQPCELEDPGAGGLCYRIVSRSCSQCRTSGSSRELHRNCGCLSPKLHKWRSSAWTGMESSSPEQVTAWLAGKVPFDFRLPAAESAPERNHAYRLTGATLVNFKGSPAALVTTGVVSPGRIVATRQLLCGLQLP